jgi:hypothetical protein
MQKTLQSPWNSPNAFDTTYIRTHFLVRQKVRVNYDELSMLHTAWHASMLYSLYYHWGSLSLVHYRRSDFSMFTSARTYLRFSWWVQSTRNMMVGLISISLAATYLVPFLSKSFESCCSHRKRLIR